METIIDKKDLADFFKGLGENHVYFNPIYLRPFDRILGKQELDEPWQMSISSIVFVTMGVSVGLSVFSMSQSHTTTIQTFAWHKT